jgi:NodT family efflux transporter outer membrane factor (OMF) lipoprotein
MRSLSLSALALSALLAGCVPNVAPQQSALKTRTLGLGQWPAPTVAPDWWRSFGDPQLDRLVDAALRDNPSLQAAMARLRGARAAVQSQRSQLFPQVDLNGQEQREHFSKNYIIPPPYGGTDRWIGSVSADLSWSIDFWGAQAAQIAKAKALASAAALDAAAARLAIAGAVTQSYVQLDRADKLLAIAEATARQRQDVLAITNKRLAHGLDDQVAQKEAQSLLAEARQAVEQARANRDIVVHALAALIGRGADAYAAIKPPKLHLDAAIALPKTLPADLLARRPDILSAHLRVEAALAGRKAAKAAFYPNINLIASAGFQAIGLDTLFDASSGTYGAGPAIHLPIFDAGKLDADYRGATADLDRAVADYNGALTQAIRQTADAITQVQSLQRQQDQQQQRLRDAQDGYRMARTRYRTGLENQIVLLNAENIQLQARTADVALAADAATARVSLIMALGGGIDLHHPLHHPLAKAATTPATPSRPDP